MARIPAKQLDSRLIYLDDAASAPVDGQLAMWVGERTQMGNADLTWWDNTLTVNGGVALGEAGTQGLAAGTLQFKTGHFQGYDGTSWKTLDAFIQEDGGTAGQVAFYSQFAAITGSDDFKWDTVYSSLQLGGGTYGATARINAYASASYPALLMGAPGANREIARLYLLDNGPYIGDSEWLVFSFGGSEAQYDYARLEATVDAGNGVGVLRGRFDIKVVGGASNTMNSVITCRSTGWVGIGQTDPVERLDVNGALRIGAAIAANAGTIQWTGSQFQGYTGSSWVNFGASGGLSGSGASSRVAYWDGTSSLTGSSNFTWSSDALGITGVIQCQKTSSTLSFGSYVTHNFAHDATGYAVSAFGVDATSSSAGAHLNLYGISAYAGISGGHTVTTMLAGLTARATVDAGSSANSVAGLYVPSEGTSGTATNRYGLYIGSQSGASNNYGIFLDEGNNRLKGNTIIGNSTSYQDCRLQVKESTYRQLDLEDWLDLSGTTDGRALVGCGAYLRASDSTYRRANTHASLVSSGMVFNRPNYGEISWFITSGAPYTRHDTFSPTMLMTLNSSGNLYVNGEVQARMIGGSGQVRLVGSTYGVMLRNDDSDTYILLTASGSPYGSWNDYRPFQIQNSTGDVRFASGRVLISHSTGVITIPTLNSISSSATTGYYRYTSPSGDTNTATKPTYQGGNGSHAWAYAAGQLYLQPLLTLTSSHVLSTVEVYYYQNTTDVLTITLKSRAYNGSSVTTITSTTNNTSGWITKTLSPGITISSGTLYWLEFSSAKATTGTIAQLGGVQCYCTASTMSMGMQS